MSRRVTAFLVIAFGFLNGAAVSAESKWLERQRALYDQPLSRADSGLKWIQKSEQGTGIVTASEIDPLKQIRLQKSRTIRELDVAIDWSKLRYDGCNKIHQDKDLGVKGTSALQLKSSYHRYSYGANIVIFAKRIDVRDQLLIHGCLRGLQVLKLRYPAVYKDLYNPQGTLSLSALKNRFKSDSQKIKGRTLPWINVNSKVIFVINNDGQESVQSVYLLGQAKKRTFKAAGTLSVYHNSIVITLNVARLSHRGSQSVYRGMSQRDAFLYYIRDGIVETLVHEGLHCLISGNRHINKQFKAIRGFQSLKSGGFGKRGKSIEEAIVCNSSLRFFEGEAVRKTGLHKSVFEFYRKAMFEKIHIPRVKALNKESGGQVFKRLKIESSSKLETSLRLKRRYIK